MIEKGSLRSRLLIGLAAMAVVVAACSGGGASQAPASEAPASEAPASEAPASAAPSEAVGGYHIGVSNTLQGNGWREQMICSMKAEALKSGLVDKMTIINQTTDTAGQIADLRSLISAGVDAMVLNPTSNTALNDVIKEATDKGIVVVAVDQGVDEPTAYVVSNDQENYGYLGAKWLFDKLGGSGKVVYMRGIDGVPADSDRDAGFKRALAEYPGIEVVKEVFTGWDVATGAQQINEIFSSGIAFDGVWTSGIDIPIVEAFKSANKPFVPIVGADNNKFVAYLGTEAANGLVGAAVTNPPPVGGAGVWLALQVLQGQAPAERVTLLTPEVWDNTTPEGQAIIAEAPDPELNDYYGVTYRVEGMSGYEKADLIACKGPGE
ncbi:MAG TPA: ABC transporter substrate-binding protein [Candidatus Limnocylindrales bacterium]